MTLFGRTYNMSKEHKLYLKRIKLEKISYIKNPP